MDVKLEASKETAFFSEYSLFWRETLDLLLHLIQDKKLDIHTLSLKLCAPFLSYVKNTSQIQLENACQFIYIAASLIAIARSLFSNPITEEEDIQTEEALKNSL